MDSSWEQAPQSRRSVARTRRRGPMFGVHDMCGEPSSGASQKIAASGCSLRPWLGPGYGGSRGGDAVVLLDGTHRTVRHCDGVAVEGSVVEVTVDDVCIRLSHLSCSW